MNRLPYRYCFGFFLAGFFLSANVLSHELRIGFVSTERIFKEGKLASAAQTRLAKEFSKHEKELGDLGASLKAMSDRFEVDAPTLSATQRTSRQKLLADMDREFQRARSKYNEDLTNRKNDERELLLERANSVVKHFAETEDYDLVLQNAVYVDSKLDITEKIVTLLNSELSK